MAVYILDASAIIALEERCADTGYPPLDVLSVMTDLAEGGELISPVAVVRECRELAETEVVVVWLRAASGHFRDTSDPSGYYDQVLEACDGLFDPESLDESTQVIVLALALHRLAGSQEVIVVTDEWASTPIGVGLGPSAAKVSVTAIDVIDFISRVMP